MAKESDYRLGSDDPVLIVELDLLNEYVRDCRAHQLASR